MGVCCDRTMIKSTIIKNPPIDITESIKKDEPQMINKECSINSNRMFQGEKPLSPIKVPSLSSEKKTSDLLIFNPLNSSIQFETLNNNRLMGNSIALERDSRYVGLKSKNFIENFSFDALKSHSNTINGNSNAENTTMTANVSSVIKQVGTFSKQDSNEMLTHKISQEMNNEGDQKLIKIQQPNRHSYFLPRNIIKENDSEDIVSEKNNSIIYSIKSQESFKTPTLLNNLVNENLKKTKIKSMIEGLDSQKIGSKKSSKKDSISFLVLDKCDNGHELNFIKNGEKCSKCPRIENMGKECIPCKQYFCWMCCGLDYNQSNCVCSKPLTFKNSAHNCFDCEEIVETGMFCEDCMIFFCKFCLKLKIDTFLCKNSHLLEMGINHDKIYCEKCGNSDNFGRTCNICKVFICYFCCGIDINNNQCFFNHKLNYDSKSILKCIKCKNINKIGKSCLECDFLICYLCSNLQINESLCFCLKATIYNANNSEKNCLICNGIKLYGKECQDCNIIICCDCLKMKIYSNLCFGYHELEIILSNNELECYSCKKIESQGKCCRVCKYFICLECSFILPTKIYID